MAPNNQNSSNNELCLEDFLAIYAANSKGTLPSVQKHMQRFTQIYSPILL